MLYFNINNLGSSNPLLVQHLVKVHKIIGI